MEPRSPSKSKLSVLGVIYSHRWFRIGLSLFFILLFLSLGVYFALRSGKNLYLLRRPYFTVVVDCGSTGTRVSVYKWVMKEDSSSIDLPLLVHSYPDKSSYDASRRESCQYHCLQTEPGLDKFLGNFSGVRASLEPLIHRAEQWVPPERHGDTPIFVLATAGLRRLPREDAIRVLEDVEVIVKEHSFMYRENWIRVLTGQEEAYYGWVALNYKMGRFNESKGLPTLGLLDLGGSSLQVVAETDETKGDEDVMRSKIGSFEHRILAYSWATFGLNEAFDRTVSILSHPQDLKESTNDRLKIRHPCLSSTYLQNYTCGGCSGVTSTNISGRNASRIQNDMRNSVLLGGDPDWDRCQELARAAAANSSSLNDSWIIDSSKCNAGVDSSIGMLDLANITHRIPRFHALSGFFAVYTKLDLSPVANLTKIWEKGKQLCRAASLNSTNSLYSGHFCFQVPYLASLIENALCLRNKEIVFGPGDVSWTLGAALVEGGDIARITTFTDQTSVLTHKNTGLVSCSIFLFVVLVCLLFIAYRTQVKLPMIGQKVAAVGGVSLPSYISLKQSPN